MNDKPQGRSMQCKTPFTVYILAAMTIVSAVASENDTSNGGNGNLTVLQIAGKKLFELKGCIDCHTLAEAAEGKLTPVVSKRHANWFEEHVQENSQIVLREEKSKRKQRSVLKAEIEALDAYLFESNRDDKSQMEALHSDVFNGAYLLYQNNCLNCHTIAGAGKDLGPDLTRVGNKRDKDWLFGNLNNPQQFAVNSEMPKFDHLSQEAKNRIIAYMLTLR
jgi:cbb3-type cytochrome oxidase cytochrome c subunit